MLLTAPACVDEVASPLDELLITIDATRAVHTGHYATTSPQQSAIGEYDAEGGGVRLVVASCPGIQPPCPEVKLIGGLVYVKSSSFPTVGASTTWLSVPLDRLGPLENRAPGLADEVAALGGGAPPPGVGPALAALRTSTSATQPVGKPLRAQLDLSNLDRLAPRDQDAVVAWAGLWSRRGGTRDLSADVTIARDGRLDKVVFDPDGDTPAGPLTLSLIDLGAPVDVTSPLPANITPLR